MPFESGEATPWRPVIIDARNRLASDRARLRRQHDRGSPGIQVCSRMTDLLDGVIVQLYETALQEVGGHAQVSEIALVAHGGYGRRDVAPYSDVDIMLLATPAAESRAADLARKFTRDVCDSGLQLGFSLRTPAECCALAAGDATILTSLTESRLLAGNLELFRRFMHRYRRFTSARSRSLLEMVVKARQAERRQYGETVYMLEPNLKRSRGGLRDVQSVRWFGFIKHGQADLESLYRMGVLTQVDWRRLRQTHEFLLRLRNEVHFHAGKSQDVLNRHEQVRLAELYHYQKIGGMLPVERFMRDYFEHTGDVRYISAHFIAGARARSELTASIGTLFSHRVERDFRIGPVHISATRKGLPRICSDLTAVLRIMDLANMYNKRIDHPTWEAIRNAMTQRLDDEISSESIHRFLSLLSQPGRLADLLRRLHQLRVLERLVPAMRHARCLIQFNDYHKYTVDEHAIRAVQFATELVDDPGVLGETYRQLHDKRLLHLALLIHDLGKGYEEDHSEVGERIAGDTARRLQLSDRDAHTLRFLVRHHLLMPHMAFREDLSDERAAVRLAVQVGSPEILQMLYIHSCADLAAVGPGVLNAWKLDLLTELYFRTRQQLTGQDASSSVRRLSEQRRQAVRAQLDPHAHDGWWERQIEALPATYLLDNPPEQTHKVLKKLKELGPKEAMAWAQYVPRRAACVYAVGTTENVTPGVFHKLTGALTAQGLQILSAQIHTLAECLVLDRFYVQDPDFIGEPPEHRLQQICDAMVKSLTVGANEPPMFRRLWQSETGARAADFASMPTQIRFDDATSERHTIITIVTYDRRGLLYRIARTLFELNLSVHVAKIGTYLDQVVDVFYVTDHQGRKIYDDPWLAEIRQRLTTAIDADQGPI